MGFIVDMAVNFFMAYLNTRIGVWEFRGHLIVAKYVLSIQRCTETYRDVLRHTETSASLYVTWCCTSPLYIATIHRYGDRAHGNLHSPVPFRHLDLLFRY